MPSCTICFPWTLPLAMPAQRTPNGATVGLRFEQWLLFHLHVLIHQKDQWAGEIPLPEKSLDQTLERVYS